MNVTDVPLTLGPGIHNLSADEYHRDPSEQPSLSASIAHILLTRSPMHARAAHPRFNPDAIRRQAQHLDIGVAAHALLLEGKEAVHIINAPDYRTKEAQDARDEAYALGQVPILAEKWSELQDMAFAVWRQLETHNASPPPFTAGQPEKSIVWTDDGVMCRARLDWLRDDSTAVDDLKSTSRSANPEVYSRNLFATGGDVQAAMYVRGVEKLTGERPQFRWIVVETMPPYALSVVAPGPDVLAFGEAKVERAIALWRECVANDRWPGYTEHVAYAELPPWEEARWLEREAREAA